MRRLTWSIIRRKFYDFFYNLKTATCKITIYHNTDYRILPVMVCPL